MAIEFGSAEADYILIQDIGAEIADKRQTLARARTHARQEAITAKILDLKQRRKNIYARMAEKRKRQEIAQ